MKINEVVVQHPALKRKETFDNLLKSDDLDDLNAFVMDDNNSLERRLALLKRIDLLLTGDAQETYDEDDLEDFMHDQGDWKDNLRTKLANVKKKDYGWEQDMSDEEIEIQIAKDLKLPPYHLSIVDEETFSSDADIPTGEYEICKTCGGSGEVEWDHTDEWTGEHVPAKGPCPDCEGGLNDITGSFKVPDFD